MQARDRQTDMDTQSDSSGVARTMVSKARSARGPIAVELRRTLCVEEDVPFGILAHGPAPTLLCH